MLHFHNIMTMINSLVEPVAEPGFGDILAFLADESTPSDGYGQAQNQLLGSIPHIQTLTYNYQQPTEEPPLPWAASNIPATVDDHRQPARQAAASRPVISIPTLTFGSRRRYKRGNTGITLRFVIGLRPGNGILLDRSVSGVLRLPPSNLADEYSVPHRDISQIYILPHILIQAVQGIYIYLSSFGLQIRLEPLAIAQCIGYPKQGYDDPTQIVYCFEGQNISSNVPITVNLFQSKNIKVALGYVDLRKERHIDRCMSWARDQYFLRAYRNKLDRKHTEDLQFFTHA